MPSMRCAEGTLLSIAPDFGALNLSAPCRGEWGPPKKMRAEGTLLIRVSVQWV